MDKPKEPERLSKQLRSMTKHMQDKQQEFIDQEQLKEFGALKPLPKRFFTLRDAISSKIIFKARGNIMTDELQYIKVLHEAESHVITEKIVSVIGKNAETSKVQATLPLIEGIMGSRFGECFMKKGDFIYSQINWLHRECDQSIDRKTTRLAAEEKKGVLDVVIIHEIARLLYSYLKHTNSEPSPLPKRFSELRKLTALNKKYAKENEFVECPKLHVTQYHPDDKFTQFENGDYDKILYRMGMLCRTHKVMLQQETPLGDDESLAYATGGSETQNGNIPLFILLPKEQLLDLYDITLTHIILNSNRLQDSMAVAEALNSLFKELFTTYHHGYTEVEIRQNKEYMVATDLDERQKRTEAIVSHIGEFLRIGTMRHQNFTQEICKQIQNLIGARLSDIVRIGLEKGCNLDQIQKRDISGNDVKEARISGLQTENFILSNTITKLEDDLKELNANLSNDKKQLEKRVKQLDTNVHELDDKKIILEQAVKELNEENSQLRESKAELMVAIDETEEEKKSIEDERDGLQKKYNEYTKKVNDTADKVEFAMTSINQRLSRAKQTVQRFKKDKEALLEDKQFLRSRIKILEKEKSAFSQKLEEQKQLNNNQYINNELICSDLQDEINKLKDNLTQARQDTLSNQFNLKEKITSLEKKIKKLEQDNAKLKKSIEELTKQNTGLTQLIETTSNQSLITENENLADEIDRLQADLLILQEKLENEKVLHEDENNRLVTNVNTKQEELDRTIGDLENLERENESLNDKVNKLRRQIIEQTNEAAQAAETVPEESLDIPPDTKSKLQKGILGISKILSIAKKSTFGEKRILTKFQFQRITKILNRMYSKDLK